ncbi:glycoside hydrolase family 3 protein [Pelagibacterium lacus]|nr:glycoside hydrolase family 3 N-terminal domain-containing protein [Pelagibacterium lacus]
MSMRIYRRFLLALVLIIAPGGLHAQSIEDMAGQMIMLGFNGDAVTDAGVRAVREQIGRGEIGGVMYLRTNVASLPAIRSINGALVAARPWLPPFIALDQEGGQIERLTRAVGFAEIPSAAAVARQGPEAARAIYAELGRNLAREGFNVNFGPVVDLDLNPANPIIARYERAYGSDAETVTAFARAFIEGHHAAGMGTALKHFPGHGSSTGDTHDGFVDVTEVWQESELDPYRALIGAGLADMIMVAHLFNAEWQDGDALQLPASLSPHWIAGVLRGELGFEGVVISDDLEMGAIRSRFDLEETVVRAVAAGNDILLFSNTVAYDPELGTEIHAILVEKAGEDPRFASLIEASYGRIIALKRRLGIMP